MSYRKQLDAMFGELKARIKFHYDSGLEEVEYIMEHDFIRGWQVYEERVLNFVFIDYHNVYSSVKRTIEWMDRTIDDDDIKRKEDTWWSVRNNLEGRIMLMDMARDNITTADRAYRTGEPILTYRATIDRRYDMSFISLELLRKGQTKQQYYYNGAMQGLNESETALKQLIDIGETFVYNHTFNETDFDAAEYLFRKGCRLYNYRLFMIKERVIKKPLESIHKRINKFNTDKDDLYSAYDALITNMDLVTELIETANASHWKSVHHLINKALNYEQVLTNNKTFLAQLATSVTMAEDIRQLKIQFTALRSRAQEVSDNWRQISAAYQQMWDTMVSETSTQQFYEMIHNDTVHFFANSSWSDFYYRIFAGILEKDQDYVRSRDPEDLWYLMNADFHNLNLSQKILQIRQDFLQIQSNCKIAAELKDKDEVFLQTFEALTESLEQFLSQNKMNQQFYR